MKSEKNVGKKTHTHTQRERERQRKERVLTKHVDAISLVREGEVEIFQERGGVDVVEVEYLGVAKLCGFAPDCSRERSDLRSEGEGKGPCVIGYKELEHGFLPILQHEVVGLLGAWSAILVGCGDLEGGFLQAVQTHRHSGDKECCSHEHLGSLQPQQGFSVDIKSCR